METGQFNGADADIAVNGDFNDALCQLLPTPTANIAGELDPSLVPE